VADDITPANAGAWYGLVATAALPLVAGAAAWLGKWFERRRNEDRQDRDLLVADLRGQVGDGKSEVALLREQNGQLRSLNDRYREEHAGCREDVVALWGSYNLLYDAAGRQVAALRKLGGEVPDLPPKPEPPPRPARLPETDFLRRTAAQGQTLIDEFHQRKAGDGGGGDAGAPGGAADPGR
jgi:hypothetical protein